MKQMLASWSSVIEKEYPQYVHLIPYPDDFYLSNIENVGVITYTCNSSQKLNRLISSSFNGVVHSMFFHNHMPNFWVKNVLDSLTEFLTAHLNDSLDKVAPNLLVSPGFLSLTRSFDKMFSLCENYTKGLGEVFRQWIMDNHYGELLFHVYIVSSGVRRDVASMDAMEIFCNRKYCVEFLKTFTF